MIIIQQNIDALEIINKKSVAFYGKFTPSIDKKFDDRST